MSDPGAQGSEGGEGTAVWGCAEWGLDRGQKLVGPAQELLLHQAACQAQVLACNAGVSGKGISDKVAGTDGENLLLLHHRLAKLHHTSPSYFILTERRAGWGRGAQFTDEET